MQPIAVRHNAYAVLAVNLAFLFFASPIPAQKLNATRPTPPSKASLDSAEDPCFKKLIANDRVRVLRVDVAPHQSTAMNRHAHDYLIVSLNGAQLEADGSNNSFPLEMDSGEMQVMKGGWPHRLNNKADQPSHLLELEILREIEPERAVCGLSRRTCTDGEFRKTEEGSYSTSTLFETPTVKLKKVYISPGGSLPQHRHPGGDVMIALTTLKLNDEFGDESEVQLTAGEVRWLKPGADHGLKNVAGEEARFLELELK